MRNAVLQSYPDATDPTTASLYPWWHYRYGRTQSGLVSRRPGLTTVVRPSRVALVQADNDWGLERLRTPGDIGDLFRLGGRASLTPDTRPNTNTYQSMRRRLLAMWRCISSPSHPIPSHPIHRGLRREDRHHDKCPLRPRPRHGRADLLRRVPGSHSSKPAPAPAPDHIVSSTNCDPAPTIDDIVSSTNCDPAPAPDHNAVTTSSNHVTGANGYANNVHGAAPANRLGHRGSAAEWRCRRHPGKPRPAPRRAARIGRAPLAETRAVP
jgi:hypothetical protein